MALTRGRRLSEISATRINTDVGYSDVGNSNIDISESDLQNNTSDSRYIGNIRQDDSEEKSRDDIDYSMTYSEGPHWLGNGRVSLNQRPSAKYSRKNVGKFKSLYNTVRSFFFTDIDEEERQKRLLKRAYYNNHRLRHGPSSIQKERRMTGSRARSDRRSLKEKVLRNEKSNRERMHAGFNEESQLESSQSKASLIRRMDELEKELKKTYEELKFTREKNTLFEKLLDEANVDRSYVKSRRDIRNLEKQNIKPQDELPPSPERKVNPLVTSSPIRRMSIDKSDRNINLAPPKLNFYSKYPTIPHTESLTKTLKPPGQADELNDEPREEVSTQGSSNSISN